MGVTGARLDPGDQAFDVRIYNDGSKPVLAKQCVDDACREFASTTRLLPGAATSATTSDMGVANPYRLTTEAGATLGCLRLVFHKKQPDALVRTSARTAC